MKRTSPWLAIILMALSASNMSGCATTQGSVSADQSGDMQITSMIARLLDNTGRTFKGLVDEGKYKEALEFFNANFKDYFQKLYIVEKRVPPPELITLATQYSEGKYKQSIVESVSELRAIVEMGESSSWESKSSSFSKADTLYKKIARDGLIVSSRTLDAIASELKSELTRVAALSTSKRTAALERTFDRALETGEVVGGYPVTPFVYSDYVNSSAFQLRISELLEKTKLDSQRKEIAQRLKYFMAPTTESKAVHAVDIRRAKERLLADGRISLEEVAEINKLAKQYGSGSGFEGMAKIGFVDLTATSFRDRNAFDFEIQFVRDYGMSLTDAKDVFLGSANLADYDFIFVVDLSAAKIMREFKNKRDIQSRMQTGTRQEQNPEYVTAANEYQLALAEMQKTKMGNAISGATPCYGNAWACAIAAGLRGASDGIAESNAKEKAEQLSKISQTVSKPVYAQYNYQVVDVSESKIARVDYYVIDVKKKQVLSSYFEIKDHEKFLVSYNVHDNDPDKTTISRTNQKEEDVTAWEKKPVSVRLSDLFAQNNISSAHRNSFSSVEAFLKPLRSKKYASAAPTYSQGNAPVAHVKGSDSRQVRKDATTIADERFDSVVIVKNAKSIGTGFYVTPELILTAYHVVDKANLVEITFYDGTTTYGKVVDHDVRLDLALIKAQTTGKPVKIFRGAIKLGETVEAIGHPKGYEFTITRGVISAVRKQSSLVTRSSAPVEFIQTDTPISPGNSGGPLFFKDAVVGVNDWVRVDKASQNLNFSVSYNEVKAYLDRFEAK
jgi:serine protease Do